MIFGIKSTVLFSIFISFLIFSFIILSYQYEISDGSFVSRSSDITTPKEFYSNHISDEKQIFILGSSQVLALNSIYIDNFLSKNNLDYEIYNLASITDTPKQRLGNLDLLISSKPEIVLYGISPRDFGDILINETKKPLPDPSALFISFLNTYKNSLGFDASLFEYPQRITLSYIIDFLGTVNRTSDIIAYENTPFMTVPMASTLIHDNIDNTGLVYSDLKFSKENADYIALQKIISKLKENDISVILFIIPQHKSTLQNYSEDYVESFMSLLDEISKTQNLTFHNLFSKYSEMNIWTDRSHIAINKKSIVYSEDVAKIIIMEIKQ